MPRLIDSANVSKPGLDLQYANSVQTCVELLKTAVENGIPSARYLVNLNTAGIHFCAIDYRLVDGIPSVISFEPTNPVDLAVELDKRLSKIPAMRFLVVMMNIQRSDDDCGMFSLAFAKKLHKEQDWMTALHQKNAAGELRRSDTPYTSLEETDKLAPFSLYKHSQTRTRSAEYLERNPDKGNAVVNKKNETLLEFQQRHTRTLPTGFPRRAQPPVSVINFSIHEKRLREYEQLDARTVEVRPEGHQVLSASVSSP